MDLKDPERIWMNKAEALAYVQAVFPTLTENSSAVAEFRRKGPEVRISAISTADQRRRDPDRQAPPGVLSQTHDGLTPRGLSPDRKRPVALLDDLGHMPNLHGAAGVHECATVTVYSRLW
jgi:hypothetical protein